MAFLGTLLAQAALLSLLRSTSGSVYDKVVSRNSSNASSESGTSHLDGMSGVGTAHAENPPRLEIANVSREESASHVMLLSASGAAQGSGQHFYAEVCAAMNCRRSLPLSHVHKFGDEAAVGKSGDTCIVAFRGTANLAGAMLDVGSAILAPFGCSGCQVGAGFKSGYESVAGQIKGALHSLGCHSVAVTGHSLGAAKAILAMYDLATSGFHIDTSYVFGEPRMANGAFQGSFHSVVHAAVFRVVHGKDPIPNQGGVGALNVGTEIYEAGDSFLTDHLHYSGVDMTACMPDGVPGGAAAEKAGEALAHAADAAARAAACCLRFDMSCCLPR